VFALNINKQSINKYIFRFTVIFEVIWRMTAAANLKIHVCSDLNQFGTFNLFQVSLLIILRVEKRWTRGAGRARLVNRSLILLTRQEN